MLLQPSIMLHSSPQRPSRTIGWTHGHVRWRPLSADFYSDYSDAKSAPSPGGTSSLNITLVQAMQLHWNTWFTVTIFRKYD